MILRYHAWHIVSESVKLLSRVQLFETSWTAACQAPLSMGFPRQDHWSGLPLPSLEDLPDPGIEPTSHVDSALNHLRSLNTLCK